MKTYVSKMGGIVLGGMALALPAYAQLKSPIQAQSTTEVLNSFFGILIQIGAVAVTLAIIYAGFLFVVARGNPSELEKAKKTLFWTVIGALVLLGAQVIAKAIESTIKTLQ